jgi:hypothetical protein
MTDLNAEGRFTALVTQISSTGDGRMETDLAATKRFQNETGAHRWLNRQRVA